MSIEILNVHSREIKPLIYIYTFFDYLSYILIDILIK